MTRVLRYALILSLFSRVEITMLNDMVRVGKYRNGPHYCLHYWYPRLGFPWVSRLFEVSVASFNIISRIFTIGPSFNIEAQAQASLEAELSAEVDLGVAISNASAFIPSSIGPNGTFSITQSGTSISDSQYSIVH